MKKILWLIFLIISSFNFVSAQVYYSDYSNFSDFQEEAVTATDTIDVIKEARYLWYKNNEVLKDYQLYNEYDKFSDDCYLTEYTNWMSEKFDNIGYIYETREKYTYTKSKEARYIHLYNLQGSYGAFRIPELNVSVDGKKINYTFTCSGCNSDFGNYINNGNYDENSSYIDNNGSLIIDLAKSYPITKIKVLFYIYDLGNTDKLYTIGFSNDKKDIYSKQSYTMKFSDYYWDNAQKVTKTIYDLNVPLSTYSTTYDSYEKESNDYIIDTKINYEYRYQEKWCKVYTLEKEYSNYSKEPIGDYVYKEEDSLKYFYSYRTRDKIDIELKEITNKNFDLNNFINSSTGKVTINNNIDWNKNGTYDIQFKLNDLIVKEKVVLNIEENTISSLEEQIKEYQNKIKNLEEQLNKCNLDKECLNKKIDQLTNEISTLNNKLKEKEEEISSLNKLNDFNKTRITDLENDIKELNVGIGNLTLEKEKLQKELDNQQLPNYILKIGNLDNRIILIIFILLLYLSYLIGKKSNKK